MDTGLKKKSSASCARTSDVLYRIFAVCVYRLLNDLSCRPWSPGVIKFENFGTHFTQFVDKLSTMIVTI